MYSLRLAPHVKVMLAVGVVVFGYHAIDRMTNFREVTAVIDDVSDKCQRNGSTLGAFTNGEPLAQRDCDSADLTRAISSPFRVAIARTFFVRYVSPVDQREHRGSIRSIGFPEELVRIPADRRIPILAHLSKPDVIKTVEQ